MVNVIQWSGVFLGLFCLGLEEWESPWDNSLPATAKEVLAKADKIEVFLLNPSRKPRDKNAAKERDRFCGWGMQSSVKVTDKERRAKVVASIEKAVADSTALDRARCFIPHHGLRATGAGKTVELVICFRCKRIEVYVDKECQKTVATTTAPEEILDKILDGGKASTAPSSSRPKAHK